MTTPPAAPARDLTRISLSVLGIALLISGSLWVLKPFIGAILWAATIVVATWPVLLRLERALGGRRRAATVMTLVLLVLLFAPLWVAVTTVVEQSDRVAAFVKDLPSFRLPPPPAWVIGVPLVGAKLAEKWAALSAMPPQELAAWLAPHVRTAFGWFAQQAGTIGAMLVNFLLTVAIAAILYVRGESAAAQVRRFFRRLADARGEVIVDLAGKAIRAVAIGIVVTALIQAVICAIGLFGVGMPFAGVITAIAFVLCIAQLGPVLALLPCVIWMYASGSPIRGTALLVTMLVAMTLDNVIRPVLIKRGADISLLLILPGVIGGLLWLGIIGLFIGPVVLAVTATLLDGWISAELGPAPKTAGTSAPTAPPAAAPGPSGAGAA